MATLEQYQDHLAVVRHARLHFTRSSSAIVIFNQSGPAGLIAVAQAAFLRLCVTLDRTHHHSAVAMVACWLDSMFTQTVEADTAGDDQLWHGMLRWTGKYISRRIDLRGHSHQGLANGYFHDWGAHIHLHTHTRSHSHSSSHLFISNVAFITVSFSS